MMKSDRSRNRALMVDDNADVSFRALDTTNTGMIQFKGTDCYHTDVIKTILTTPNGRFITAGYGISTMSQTVIVCTSRHAESASAKC